MPQKNSSNRSFPDFLESCRKSAQELGLGAVGDVLFSGPTYQVEIQDLPQSRWVFLQLGTDDTVNDIFCSCDESTAKGACPHMALALLFVFRAPKPLHKRFDASFFRHFFFLKQQSCRSINPEMRETPQGYDFFSEEGLLLSATGKRKLQELIAANKEQTEETSLKFSLASDEELEFFRQGRPGLEFRFELSCLSDMAKWFFLQQDKANECQLEFIKTKALPEEIILKSEKMTVLSKISVKELDALVEFLPTISSCKEPLLTQEEIALATLTFDKKQKQFIASYDKKRFEQVLGKKHLPCGRWDYYPNLGFYAKDEAFKEERVFGMCDFIEKWPHLVEKTGFPLSHEKELLDIHLVLDREGSLRIEGNEEAGENWAFFPERGFVALQPLQQLRPGRVVTKDELGAFLKAHRGWLSNFPGFTVHMSRPQEQIGYRVLENGSLVFYSSLEKKLEKAGKQHDLGQWVFVDGSGFYMKVVEEEFYKIPLNHPIMKYEVAEFIRYHHEALQDVEGFFSPEVPISRVGLLIQLQKKGVISIIPEYEWQSFELAKSAINYDEYFFIPGKGFCRLPLHMRPSQFMQTIYQDDKNAWDAFFLEQLPKLQQEFVCSLDRRLQKAEGLVLTIAAEGEGAKVAEYDLDIFWSSKQGKVVAEELLAAKKRAIRFVPTQAGLVDLEEDRFHWLDILKSRKEKKNQNAPYRLKEFDFLRIQAYEGEIQVETVGTRAKEFFKKMLGSLLDQTLSLPPDISTLMCRLRPYQVHGVDWLWFLYQNELSGLLCDDMGVGKTHQAMGLMAAISSFFQKEGKKPLFLVACPTSLVYHWEDKLHRFLPAFRVCTYAGTLRVLEEDAHVILTTYGILRNESAKLKRFFFDAAFFDELQIAKNHISQVHKALLAVHARMKVGITGTPIENQLRELKALFDIVLPGYMPEDAQFREFFMRPIEKLENPGRKELLSRFVRPFVLRRRKVDVLPDLPVKTEEICFADLKGEQKKLYQSVAAMQAAPLIQQLKDESLPIPYMHIFALLTSLKQICNHPAAYLRDMQNFERYESGKWDTFVELIEEAKESEQKVVVFSQYLHMLDIIGLFCQKAGLGFAEVRGQTKNRAGEIARFQNEKECQLFLGSLQAAGLGIDLTAASIVIHYDRWWNAAREDQATDRVHRIGQTRGVQVFKLLTKDTIEEHIDSMIIKKSGLLEDVVSFDDHRIVKRLTRKEILTLLEGFK